MATATEPLTPASPLLENPMSHEIESAATAAASTVRTAPLKIEFTGGLEILFRNRRQHTIHLPLHKSSTGADATSVPPTIRDLVIYLTSTFLSGMPKARRELFSVAEDEITEDQQSTLRPDPFDHTAGKEKLEEERVEQTRLTVRPGILVLVNDADWELEGGAEAELQEGDEVVFVSTLHGG